MTVKCFTTIEKDQICLAYTHKTMTMGELAQHFGTSKRTIGRVLEERGLATPVPRLKGEAHQAMQLLAQAGVDIPQLRVILKTKVQPVPTSEMHAILDILVAYGLTAAKLTAVLNRPSVSPTNVQEYLNQCSKEELAHFFYTSGLVKLTEITKQVDAQAPQQ